MVYITKLCVFLCFALFVCNVHSLTLSNTLGSNMVLQKTPARATIWGWDTAGSTVTVTIGTEKWTGVTAASGIFSVQLPAYGQGGPYTIQVSSSAGGSPVSLTNVLFGDVYVCSGQSNMQFTVHSSLNATEEIALASKYPNIRLFSVGEHNTSLTPFQQLGQIDLPWTVASPAAVGHGDWSYFSSVCWFYGRYLSDLYPTLPIGLISSNWGGTYIQAWSSPDALKKCATSPEYSKSAQIDTKFKIDDGFGAQPDPNTPSVLWNAMIVPFLKNPIKGALWYQGESNAGDPGHYGCYFKAMITDWREKFEGQTDFVFLFVLLAPWQPAGDSVAETRDAQLTALSLPNVGFASAVDLGDPTSPFGNIHPRDKEDVSRRLLLSARALAYGDTSVIYQGPRAATFVVAGTTPNAVVDVTFEPATLGGGLSLGPEPAACPAGASCGWYSIQLGTAWVRATPLVNGNTLRISVNNANNAKVAGVRYAYAGWPMISLYNKANLPAVPFSHTF